MKKTAEAPSNPFAGIQLCPVQGDPLLTTLEKPFRVVSSTPLPARNSNNERNPKTPPQEDSVKKTHSGRIVRIPTRLKG